MRTIAGERVLAIAQRGMKKDMIAALKKVAAEISGIVVRYAGLDGVIQPSEETIILTEAGKIVDRFFVGPDGRNAFARDGVTPLAPFPAILNKWYVFVVWQISQSHHTQMGQSLVNAVEVSHWLSTAPMPQRREVYAPTIDPLRLWVPMHQWSDPRGYRLNDRIWQVDARTRQKIDALLMDAIRTGESALSVSKKLERFLLPERAALRTKKPYGTDASFDAMRLARSEITRAHAKMQQVAAMANPFVDGLDFALSYRHPKVDICDALATLGMSGQRLREPYKPDEVPIPVESTHSQCLCRLQAAIMEAVSSVIAKLRADLVTGEPAPLTPYSRRNWLQALLGAYLLSVLYQEFQT